MLMGPALASAQEGWSDAKAVQVRNLNRDPQRQ